MRPPAILFLLSNLAMAEPQAPTDRMLNPEATMQVAIHAQTTTLLVFPEAVTLIAGAGLTDGSVPGDVHYQHAENPKHIVLRQLTAGSTILMQVAMGEQTYAFKLTGSDQPASIIRFHKNPVHGPAAELTAEEVRKRTLNVPQERQAQLVRLVRGEAVLRPQLPDEYEDYVTDEVFYTDEHDGIRTTINRIARFRRDNAIVLTGKLENKSSEPVDLKMHRAWVCVGEKRVPFLANYSAAEGPTVPPGQEMECSAVLVGDGRGQRLHLDPLKNRFVLTFTRTKP